MPHAAKLKDIFKLKPSLQALLVAPDKKMRDEIIRSIKKISIRERWRQYKTGLPVMLCCNIEPWAVMADVVSVRHCILTEVTKEEYQADGFENKKELFNGMKKYYPNMNWGSPVIVIRWDNVRGKLVDENDPFAALKDRDSKLVHK